MEDKEKFIEIKLKEYFDAVFNKQPLVYEIFKDFYGEDRVDMQSNISFKRFEAVFHMTPINDYIESANVNISESIFNENKSLTLDELPDDILVKVIECLNNSYTNDSIIDKLPKATIIVRFPNVRITNEHNRHVDVKDLWASISVEADGVLHNSFGISRSHYYISHWASDYQHSHTNGIPYYEPSRFQDPCLGSGPIRNTIATLNSHYDEDIWRLFCLEISRYMEVESLAGIPYRRLEAISNNNTTAVAKAPLYTVFADLHAFDGIHLKGFIDYVFNKNILKFNYANNSYSLGMSYQEYLIKLSNAFIEWFNSGESTHSEPPLTLNDLLYKHTLITCIKNNGFLYSLGHSGRYCSHAPADYIGKYLFKFKGEAIKLQIEDDEVDIDNKLYIINLNFASTFISKVLTILNHRYGRSNTTGQKTCYL